MFLPHRSDLSVKLSFFMFPSSLKASLAPVIQKVHFLGLLRKARQANLDSRFLSALRTSTVAPGLSSSKQALVIIHWAIVISLF